MYKSNDCDKCTSVLFSDWMGQFCRQLTLPAMACSICTKCYRATKNNHGIFICQISSPPAPPLYPCRVTVAPGKNVKLGDKNLKLPQFVAFYRLQFLYYLSVMQQPPLDYRGLLCLSENPSISSSQRQL